MSTMKVAVNEAFTLDVGRVTKGCDEQTGCDVFIITPPERSMLEQLIPYLQNQPRLLTQPEFRYVIWVWLWLRSRFVGEVIWPPS
jgi:hypothetical protein